MKTIYEKFEKDFPEDVEGLREIHDIFNLGGLIKDLFFQDRNYLGICPLAYEGCNGAKDRMKFNFECSKNYDECISKVEYSKW